MILGLLLSLRVIVCLGHCGRKISDDRVYELIFVYQGEVMLF